MIGLRVGQIDGQFTETQISRRQHQRLIDTGARGFDIALPLLRFTQTKMRDARHRCQQHGALGGL